MGISRTLSSILIGAIGLARLADAAVGDPINARDPALILFLQDLIVVEEPANPRAPPVDADTGVNLIDPKVFAFIEGPFRRQFEFNGLAVVNGVVEVGEDFNIADIDNIALRLDKILSATDFGGQLNLNEAIANNFDGVPTDPVGNAAFLLAQFNSLKNVAAIMVTENLAHGPGTFCLTNDQCRGVRNDSKFGETIVRTCNGINADGDQEVPGVPPTCNNFVAFFTLSWLFGWIIGVYVIFLLWAIYMYGGKIKRICSKGGKGRAAREKGKPQFNEQEQLIINTLAAQAASAENMLFQATDMLKQAKNMKNILAVEARRENRLLLLTVEFFQAVSAIMVSLTHQYIDQKTNTPGEKWNDTDPAVRALQLEVLNYVRDRLQLAFQADAFSDKSLLRIAEAYAVLKKISESLVLIGFSIDKEADETLGNLRTPIVELNENSFFMSGIFKGSRGGVDRDIEGQEVCITIKNADARGLKEVGALYYLSDSTRDCKNFDPTLQTVTPAPGKTLVYNLTNAGTQGETLQFFVRTFWGPEIAASQNEATNWLKNESSVEEWLAKERQERQQRASPVIKHGDKKKRKKNKKKDKKKGDKYTDAGDDTATEYTEYTEASGWSVASNNTYVYNVQSIVNQGLGIAGKPGLPFDNLGTTKKKSSKFYKIMESYFPNAVEWPKFYLFIFGFMPIVIAFPMFLEVGNGAGAIDIDGNVNFKARAAGFGTSYLGVPNYYFLDGDVPELDNLVAANDIANDPGVQDVLDALGLNVNDAGPFGGNLLFMNNEFSFDNYVQFDGASGRDPENFLAEIQAGVLAQNNVAELTAIRDQQKGQEIGTAVIYALMHNAGYFFGIVPLSLVRESLEILARRFPIVRDIYPMSQWRDLHMNMGLAGIFFVTVGATVFLIMLIVSMTKRTPFSGNAGDPNFANFFDMNANVLYLRQLLLPAVPLLLLMKYAARGPPVLMQKYAPTFLTKNYWEICYFLHYLTALTAIIVLVIYRPQVFYWMGATWGFVWGGNKIVRILRTRKTTIKNTNLISYSVEDGRNNAKKRNDVLRITLNVPKSFPSSSRGQACWLTVPDIDMIAHPFTLAKVPTPDDHSITFHIGIKYLHGDDIISYARPDTQSVKKAEAPATPPANPNELPPGWKSAVDPESGQTYYYNSTERRTTWTRPKMTAIGSAMETARALTTRFSTANLRGAGSTRFANVALNSNGKQNTIRGAAETKRATWTQRLAKLAEQLQTLDPDLRRNAIKEHPVYVSAPLGTSMDDCLLPSLPGSIIITTQNGLPAAESSVRWLLMQPKQHRPKFHFFVSVSREVNDALSVVETLRDSMCDSVVAGHLDIDGLNTRHAHMVDWLGVYIHLTRRKPSQIEGDRDMLMKALSPPAAPVTPQQLQIIETWIKNRVCPDRLYFERFLQRTSQMVRKRTGLDKIAVGYCGSAKIAYAIRAAAREIPNMSFDGEYI